MFGNILAERKAVELLYEDICWIFRPFPQKGENGITWTVWKETNTRIICGLSEGNDRSSFSNAHLYIQYRNGARPDSHLRIDFDRVLFLPPDVEIRQGDRVRAARFGRRNPSAPVVEFEAVGAPLSYATHTEVLLKKVDIS